jgi:hypothetical protein
MDKRKSLYIRYVHVHAPARKCTSLSPKFLGFIVVSLLYTSCEF